MTQIKTIKQSTINRALRLHKAWLDNDPNGKLLKVTTEIIKLIDFSSADFSSADFSWANFSSANFSSANFSSANFSRANFSRANFSSANFSSADFSSADFSSANFSWANFSSADFSWAKYENIKLNWMNTIGTNGLTVISCQLNTSDQNRSIQYWKKLGIVTAGCFSGTLDELKTAVEKKHKEKHKDIYAKYQAVFSYIDTVLKIESEEENEKTN